MKKICCSLLLLLFTFVCLFATIPKNKVNAESIIDNSSYDLPYLMPSIINYSFGNVKISTTPDLIYSLDAGDFTRSNTETIFYDNSILSYRLETSSQISLIDGPVEIADYWSRYDNSYDNIYAFTQSFSSFPSGSSGDLSINMVFTNILTNYQFIVDYSDVNLLKFEMPFQPANYNVELDFQVSYPDTPFGYVNANGSNWTGTHYDTHEITSTYTEYFGYGEGISLDIIKLLDLENLDIYQGTSTSLPIIITGSLKIVIPNWENVVISPQLSFYYDVVTHPFSSYQNYPERAIGYYPGPEFYQFNWLPGGLPISSSSQEDGFIEDISTSLLNGVQNFLTFEISPGFSLYHILLLVVAIPLLILILKLFLGG